MNQLIFASNNKNKVVEINSLLPPSFKIISLKEAGINIEIEEPFETIEANAIEKARVIHELTGKDCFGEDTGLEVIALDGKPGVMSARFAGEERSDGKNIRRLLEELKGKHDRSAQFKTVIALNIDNKMHLFTGICKGTILASAIGNKGFGYDPVFCPQGSERSFAEMELDEKNSFSHRKKALEQMIKFLSTHQYVNNF